LQTIRATIQNRRGVSASICCVLALAACGRSGAAGGFVPAAPPVDAEPADSGYRAAPQILQLSHGAGGNVALSGRATPSAQVRLASPAGGRIETTADGQGVWRVELGPVSEPMLYGLSDEAGGRRVQAEGYVAILPGAPTVALLRAGAGAVVLDTQGGFRLLAVDMDGGGSTVVSGRAAPGAPLRVLIDGIAAIQASTPADGRFSLTLPKGLTPGPHRLQVTSGAQSTQATVLMGPITPPTELPYRIAALDRGGWRLDWITPGEGLQTTLLLGAAETGR
jgi:hypothetical protein